MPSDQRDLDLPESLALPLETGAPWWYWLGARPALDFVNTLRERWNRNVETLVTCDDLSAWLVEAGVVDERLRVRADVLDDARELREAIDAAVVSLLAGDRAPRRAITTIDDWLVHAGPRPQLALDAGGALRLRERPAADSARRALGAIAYDAAVMLGDRRVRVCAADDCSARFYDRSPAGRRRWCSMQACGNVAKARRHRERARDATVSA